MNKQEKISAAKLLIIVNNSASMAKYLPSLKQCGYKIEIALDVNKAAENIRTFQPDVILLSWNLKNINIVKTYTFFTEQLRLPCLVFSEDQSPRTMSSLMRSRIPHTLFPPLSGQGIHRRIQLLLRGKKSENSGPKHSVRSSAKYGAIKVMAKDIDPATQWENVGSTEDGKNYEWKGTIKINETTDAMYYFKGPRKPQYNKELNRWDNLDESSAILMQKRFVSIGPSTTQAGLDCSNDIFSLIQKNKQTDEFSLSEEIEPMIKFDLQEMQNATSDLNENSSKNLMETRYEIEQEEASSTEQESFTYGVSTLNDPDNSNKDSGSALTSEEKAELQSVLARCVKDVIQTYINSPQESVHKVNTISSLFAMTIPSSRFKGYLIAGQADNNMDPHFISQFYSKLQKRMKRLGEPLHEIEKVIQVTVEPMQFKECARDFSEFIISDSLNEKEIVFAYMSLNALPKIDDYGKDGFLAVKFENWLLADSKLSFDLYIHMPVNEKYILYLKKDTIISKEILNKFLRLNVKNIFIEPSEKNLFLSYCIKIKINDGLKKAS